MGAQDSDSAHRENSTVQILQVILMDWFCVLWWREFEFESLTNLATTYFANEVANDTVDTVDVDNVDNIAIDMLFVSQYNEEKTQGTYGSKSFVSSRR